MCDEKNFKIIIFSVGVPRNPTTIYAMANYGYAKKTSAEFKGILKLYACTICHIEGGCGAKLSAFSIYLPIYIYRKGKMRCIGALQQKRIKATTYAHSPHNHHVCSWQIECVYTCATHIT